MLFRSGRYVVALSFRQNADLTVLDNRRSVTQNFLTLERRLQKNSTLHEVYCLFLKEYLELGHVNTALTRANYLLPHHSVFKDSSSTTKIRAAFNDSAL